MLFSFSGTTLMIKSINLILLILVFLISGCKKGEEQLVHEDIELNNTKWIIHESDEIPIKTTGKGLQPTLYFFDKTITVITDCNILTFSYESNGNLLKANLTFTTYLACIGEMERYFHANMSKVSSYIYNNGMLHLFIGKQRIGSFKQIKD